MGKQIEANSAQTFSNVMLPLMCTLNTCIDYMIIYVMSSYLHWPIFSPIRSLTWCGLETRNPRCHDARFHATWLTDFDRIHTDT